MPTLLVQHHRGRVREISEPAEIATITDELLRLMERIDNGWRIRVGAFATPAADPRPEWFLSGCAYEVHFDTPHWMFLPNFTGGFWIQYQKLYVLLYEAGQGARGDGIIKVMSDRNSAFYTAPVSFAELAPVLFCDGRPAIPSTSSAE